MLAFQTAVTAPTPTEIPGMLTLGALAVLYAFAEWLKSRSQNKTHAKTKEERNAELDSRLNPIRDAIGLAQQSNNMEFGKLNSRFDKVESTVETMAKNVDGLQTRELARLEADAVVTRRRKR